MDISSLLEVEVKEGKPSELRSNATDARVLVPRCQNLPPAISHDERHFYKLMFGTDIASVRFRKLHCTACDIHIGSAPADAHNMHEHPILHVLLCTSCRNFYGDGTFEQGDDATDMFCRWCANGGNLYCCSYCSNTFCYNCIKRNFDPLVRKKIERDEKWKCFVCHPADLYSMRAVCWALLEHVQTVTRILQSDRKMSPKEIAAKMELDESQCCPHKNKRKRSDSASDDEDEDETYSVPKKKRRKLVNAKRTRRRVIKMEMLDASPDVSNTDHANASRDDPNYDPNNTESQQPYELSTHLSPEELPLALRQSKRRLRSDTSTNRTPDSEAPKYSVPDDDVPPPFLQCDQTMVEGAESLSFGESRQPQKILPKPTPNMGISPIPTANLLKRPATIIGTLTRGTRDHRIIRGVGGTPLLVRKLAQLPPNPKQPVPNAPKPSATGQSVPMVSIPSRNHMQPAPPGRISVIQPPLQTPRTVIRNSSGTIMKPLRPRITPTKPGNRPPTKPGTRPPTTTISHNDKTGPPSVIDLDSDSDDPVVLVEPSGDRLESNDRVPSFSTETFPVRPDDGFLTLLSPTPRTENDTSDESHRQQENSRDSSKNYDKDFPLTTKSIDAVLATLTSKLKKVLESASHFAPDKELMAARARTRAVNRTIKRTVAELTSLNDNLVRAYKEHKRERNKEPINHAPFMRLEKRQRSSKLTPLDMECWRESEPEADEDELSDDDEDSENSQNVAPMRTIRPFRRRVHRACEAKPETANKSIQVYDVEKKDYEKSIGYALLLKADYDAKRERDILRPVMVPDMNFGKYEEAFISYLQHIEDNGLEIEESKDAESPSCVSVNELVDVDISSLQAADTNEKAVPSSDETAVGVDEPMEIGNDENIEILEEEHLEIETAKSSSSDDTGSSSSSDESETETSENGTPEKKRSEKKTSETQTPREEQTVKETTTTEKSRKINSEEKIDDTTSESTSPTKNSTRAAEEETVLAVRALIEEDSSGNSNNSNTDVLNSWKPREDDDECTILD